MTGNCAVGCCAKLNNDFQGPCFNRASLVFLLAGKVLTCIVLETCSLKGVTICFIENEK